MTRIGSYVVDFWTPAKAGVTDKVRVEDGKGMKGASRWGSRTIFIFVCARRGIGNSGLQPNEGWALGTWHLVSPTGLAALLPPRPVGAVFPTGRYGPPVLSYKRDGLVGFSSWHWPGYATPVMLYCRAVWVAVERDPVRSAKAMRRLTTMIFCLFWMSRSVSITSSRRNPTLH